MVLTHRSRRRRRARGSSPAELDAAERQLDQLRAEYAHSRQGSSISAWSRSTRATPLTSSRFCSTPTASTISPPARTTSMRSTTRTCGSPTRSPRCATRSPSNVHQVADLKQQSDAGGPAARRAEAPAWRRASRRRTRPPRRSPRARAQTQASLSDAKGQVAAARAAARRPAAHRAPRAHRAQATPPIWAAPTRSRPTSSCASRAATTTRSTPRAERAARTRSSPRPGAPTAGQGAPQDAPKAEQDRIAARSGATPARAPGPAPDQAALGAAAHPLRKVWSSGTSASGVTAWSCPSSVR